MAGFPNEINGGKFLSRSVVKVGSRSKTRVRSVKSVKLKLLENACLKHGAPPDRRRRFRQRQAAGRACYTVELGAAELDFLIRTGWLLDGEASDRNAVGAGIARMLADAARR
jgi:hypothetical protein